MAKPKPAPLPAGTAVGDYRILRVLASGGSSIVYLGQTADGQAVLLKEYLPATLVVRPAGERVPLVRPGALGRLERGVQGFLEGARHLARLQQPDLACVLDCVQAHETVYLVLRYLEGRTLQDFIVAARGRGGRNGFSELAVISVGLDLLAALEGVHAAGLLHLDVKPSNVLITLQGRLVLLDFDAALPMGQGLHTPAHTPGFSAPETLAAPQSHGPWTDVYAVGACLYACLVGHPPLHCTQRAVQDPVAHTLDALRERYAPALLELVQRALSLPIGPRPQSAPEMAQALEALAHQALALDAAAQSWA